MALAPQQTAQADSVTLSKTMNILSRDAQVFLHTPFLLAPYNTHTTNNIKQLTELLVKWSRMLGTGKR